MTPRVRRRGFSLLEVLIALGILALGMGAALSLLGSAAAAQRRAQHQATAALVASEGRQRLERALTPRGLADHRRDARDQPSPWPWLVFSGIEVPERPGYTVDGSLAPVETVGAGPELFWAELRVRWQGERGIEVQRFRTLLPLRLELEDVRK